MKKILIKELIIDNCMDCDKKIWVITSCRLLCREKNYKEIKNPKSIPKWCPLEDWKER